MYMIIGYIARITIIETNHYLALIIKSSYTIYPFNQALQLLLIRFVSKNLLQWMVVFFSLAVSSFNDATQCSIFSAEMNNIRNIFCVGKHNFTYFWTSSTLPTRTIFGSCHWTIMEIYDCTIQLPQAKWSNVKIQFLTSRILVSWL